VVKLIWHKATSPPQMNDSILFAMRAHWRNLANTIEVHIRNGKSIVSAMFAQLMAECHQACQGMSFPVIISHSHAWVSGPHLIHTSWTNPSPHPKRHLDRCIVPVSVLWGISGHALLLHIAPSDGGYVRGSWGPPDSASQMATRSIQASAVFAQFTAESSILYNGRPCPPKLPLPMGDLNSHLIHYSLGSSKSTTQKTSRFHAMSHVSSIWMMSQSRLVSA